MSDVTDINALIERAAEVTERLMRTERKRVRYGGPATERDYTNSPINPDGMAAMVLIERLLAALRTLAERDHSSDVRNMVQAAEQRGADRAFEEAAGLVDERAEACRKAGVGGDIDPIEASILDEHLSEAADAIRQRIGGQP